MRQGQSVWVEDAHPPSGADRSASKVSPSFKPATALTLTKHFHIDSATTLVICRRDHSVPENNDTVFRDRINLSRRIPRQPPRATPHNS